MISAPSTCLRRGWRIARRRGSARKGSRACGGARLEAWLPAYDDDAAWAGCTFNSFVARVADVADLAAAGFFEPVATNRADSGALERYFGYALAARSPREPPLCGRDLAGKCGLAKAHLWRPAR